MAEEEKGKTLEELEAEYKAELLKKIQIMRTGNEAKEKEDADAKAQLDKDRLEAEEIDKKEQMFTEIEERYKLKSTSDVDIENPSEETKGKENSEWTNFHANYLKAKGIEQRVDYKNVALVTDQFGFAFTDSDDDCSDTLTSWTPADVYCDLIWQAANCGRQLSGIITQRACDINAGDGLTVQIKTINASTMGDALGRCECSSCASNVFGTYPLTLARYDVYKVICELDVFSVGDSLKAAIVESMSRAFITGIDGLIWTAIRDAAPGYTETSETSFSCDPAEPTTTCCIYGANLYKEVIELEARMRAAGYGSNGFYLIMHPRVALYLKYKEGMTPPPWVNNISMDGNKLAKVGDIKVIEYCGATECTNTDDQPIAVLIDPERAVGEAYGKQPHLLTDKDPIECDSTKLIMRTYIAVAALDLNAIGHIVNP